MKHKIKKNRLKIFIALSLMITCVFSVMFATNTFAYETDKMSYTITDIGNSNSNYQSITNNTNYIDISYGSENNLYFKNQNGFTYKLYYLLINFSYLQNGNIIDRNVTSRTYINPFYVNNSNNIRQAQGLYVNTYQYNYNNGYYTLCIPFVFTTNYNETMQYCYINGWFFLGSSNGSNISTYDYRIYNIDLVTSEDLGLSQYYDTYYSNIENQYNELLNDYEELETDYFQLTNDYNALEDNYNTLENNYNTLDTTYSQMNEYYAYGALAYLKDLNVYDSNDNETYTLNDLKINQGYLSGSTIELGYIMYDTNTELGYADLDFYDNLYLSLIEFKLESDGNYPNDFQLYIYRNEQYYTTININTNPYDNANYINYDYLVENYNSALLSTDTLKGISLNNVYGYETSNTKIVFTTQNMIMYQNGYNNASYYYNQKITELTNNYNNEIQELNDRVSNLELVIETKNEQIASYARGSYGLNNLMWTIGSTPFESFKQIWNVEFLGVDIANFILGIITTFIGLYIVKKFFL